MAKTEEDLKRGHLAKQITENPLWIEYFEHAREKIQESWERSKSPEYREDLWRYSQVLRSFEKHIQTALETGQMAEMVVAEMQEKESGRRTTEH